MKKKNPPDSTTRNVRGANKRMKATRQMIVELRTDLSYLEHWIGMRVEIARMTFGEHAKRLAALEKKPKTSKRGK